MAGFDEPWAMDFARGAGTGTGIVFIAERKGHLRYRTPDGRIGTISGVPKVDYGGQGSLGDFIFHTGDRLPAWKGRALIASLE